MPTKREIEAAAREIKNRCFSDRSTLEWEYTCTFAERALRAAERVREAPKEITELPSAD